MNESNQTLLIVLAALLVGALLPLIAQLFLTARSLRRVLRVVEKRADGTLGDLAEAVAALKNVAAPVNPLMNIGAAIAPAVLAAFQAFRSEMMPEDRVNGHARSSDAEAA